MRMSNIPIKKMFVKYKKFEMKMFLISNYKAYELNSTAVAIWMLIDGQKTIADIVNIICDKFTQERYEKIMEGVTNFLHTLLESELIDFKENKIQNYEQPIIHEEKLPVAVIIS